MIGRKGNSRLSWLSTVWCKYPSLDTIWCNTDKSPHRKMRAFSSIVPAGDSIRAGVNGAPGALQSREAARAAVRANPPAPTKK